MTNSKTQRLTLLTTAGLLTVGILSATSAYSTDSATYRSFKRGINQAQAKVQMLRSKAGSSGRVTPGPSRRPSPGPSTGPWGFSSQFNENDFLAGGTLARASMYLSRAGQQIDQMHFAVQNGQFSDSAAYFGQSCSSLGLARLLVSTANMQAGQPPMGMLAQWGQDFRDVIEVIRFTKNSGTAPCPQ